MTACNYPTYRTRSASSRSRSPRRSSSASTPSAAPRPATWRNSVAAHAAAGGHPLLRDDPARSGAGQGARLADLRADDGAIRGNYDDVNRLCTEIADKYGWAIVNVNLRPYYTEGAKTYGFEIAEQLGWRLPQHTVVPTAGGTILPKIYKALPRVHRARAGRGRRAEDLLRAGGRLQPGGDGDPAGHATSSSRRSRTRSPRASRSATRPTATTRSSVVSESGGWGVSATDARSSTRSSCWRAAEGIWTEPAGGTTLACAIKLIESGRIPQGRVDRRQHHRQRPQDDRGAAGAAARRAGDRGEARGLQGDLRPSTGRASRPGDALRGRGQAWPTKSAFASRHRCGATRRGASSLELAGATVGEVLREPDAAPREAARAAVRRRRASLNRFVNVFLNEEDIRFLQGLDTKVKDGDGVELVPAIAGGSWARSRRCGSTEARRFRA